MSKARSKCSASIHRKSVFCTLPLAKLQKSQRALHEFVTATLQIAGPPWRMSRSMSQVLPTVVKFCASDGEYDAIARQQRTYSYYRISSGKEWD
jgi:hypothetical protein